MSENIPATKIEGTNDELIFTLAGAEPDVVDGCVRLRLKEVSKFTITIAPVQDGVFELGRESLRIDIDLNCLYPSSGSYDPSICIQEVAGGSTISLASAGRPYVEGRDIVLTFSTSPGVRFSKAEPIVISLALARPRFDQMMISCPFWVRLSDGRTPRAQAEFLVLSTPLSIKGDDVSMTDALWGFSKPCNLLPHVDNSFEIRIAPNRLNQAERGGYLKIPPQAGALDLSFGGLLTDGEIADVIASAKSSRPDFAVGPNYGNHGLRIASVVGRNAYITSHSPLVLKLGPMAVSGLGRHSSSKVSVCSFLDGTANELWSADVSVLNLEWKLGGPGSDSSGKVYLEDNANNNFTLNLSTSTGTGGVPGNLEIDFDGMLSEAEIDQLLKISLPDCEVSKKSGDQGVSKLVLKSGHRGCFPLPLDIPMAFVKKGPSPKFRGNLHVAAIHETGDPAKPPSLLTETKFEILGISRSLKDCRMCVQSAAPDRPIGFARNVPRSIAVEVTLKEQGFVRILPGKPLLRVDFGKLLTPSELTRMVENPPSGFRVAIEASTAILSPTKEMVILCEGDEITPLVVSLTTIHFKDVHRNPDGDIRVGLIEKEVEIAAEKIPYHVRELALSIRGAQETVRNERLYLKTKAKTAFAIEISPSSHPSSALPFELPFPQPSIEIDFGRVLSSEDVERLAGFPPPGFSASKLAGTRTLVLEPADKEFLISSKSPVRLPVEILPFEAPESKPYGTILISLRHGTTLVAGEEFDLSINHHDGDSFATPPVLVSWDDSTPPLLKAGQPGQCKFAIFNARCDRRGNAKALVTDPWSPENETDPVKPRIRLSIPPTLQSGQAVEFKEGTFFSEIKIAPASSKGRSWTVKTLGKYQELYPDKQHIHVLEGNEYLIVTLDKICPSKPGTWSLVVTLVDFPGYSSATFLLPIRVDNG